ncbi:MAG: Sua5/YciO/YrdC/YwlC family protein [Bacillota bacterium]|nr:Sua5/YciO/YrdC/YwlC family protein [Bacillota bacterium]
MAAKQSERIKLWGIVQGVGFRPYVAKLAETHGMKGQVLNMGGLVEITVTDTPERISAFLHALIENKPGPSEIVHVKREAIDYRSFDSFTIIKSDDGGNEAAMIPADMAICPNCLEELYDENNQRYQHPFISCMVCGPRYTIIDRIPYDRDNTTMSDFPMCDFCEGEYTDLHDRRYHAQTISCHDCGPKLLWKGPERALQSTGFGQPSGDAEILDTATEILKGGGVLLFKSVGGYNLVADPLNEEAVSKLRRIKNREAKPFAVMFRSLDQIKEFCHVDDVEEKLLSSSARPILLLENKLKGEGELTRSRFIGSFLPSFAVQYMLLDRISPLIFTSANLSDMPMICDDDEASDMLERHPEIYGMIYNKRRILVRA